MRSQKKHRKRPRKITRAQSCGDKDKLTMQDAKKRVYSLRKKDGANMNAYRCQFGCKLENGSRAWHVGHSVRRFYSRRK